MCEKMMTVESHLEEMSELYYKYHDLEFDYSCLKEDYDELKESYKSVCSALDSACQLLKNMSDNKSYNRCKKTLDESFETLDWLGD